MINPQTCFLRYDDLYNVYIFTSYLYTGFRLPCRSTLVGLCLSFSYTEYVVFLTSFFPPLFSLSVDPTLSCYGGCLHNSHLTRWLLLIDIHWTTALLLNHVFIPLLWCCYLISDLYNYIMCFDIVESDVDVLMITII